MDVILFGFPGSSDCVCLFPTLVDPSVLLSDQPSSFACKREDSSLTFLVFWEATRLFFSAAYVYARGTIILGGDIGGRAMAGGKSKEELKVR